MSLTRLPKKLPTKPFYFDHGNQHLSLGANWWLKLGLLTLLDERTVRANSWLDPTPRTMDFVRLHIFKFVPRVDPNGAFIE